MKVRSPYAEPVDVPWLGMTVNPGQVVDIPADQLPNWLEAGWEPADPDTRKAAAAARTRPAADEKSEG